MIKKRNSFFLFVLFLMSITNTFAQGNEGNIWYFGYYAGLTFNTLQTNGNPTPLTNGQLTTNEGVATICDPIGNLLFYTDGITVWNANHQAMSNSTSSSSGGSLLGDPSSTQSGVAIPKPLDPNTYYLFTVDDDMGSNGLRYTRIDMTLNSGLGNVVTSEKNVLLFTPSTEKIAAVKHANGVDIWVVTHEWNNNTFRTYLVTSSGVQTSTYVTSNVGVVHSGQDLSSHGYLKASPQGDKLALAIQGQDIYQLFDFNNATGIVSNAITLTGSSFNDCYGVEFSPDEHYLYGSERWGDQIYQWDITLPTSSEIISSYEIIGTTSTDYGGALQLGPDQRIYLARKNQKYLGIINYPNLTGTACTYVDQGVLLGATVSSAKSSGEGLPTFISSFFNSTEMEIVTDCDNDTVFFYANNYFGLDSVHWNFNYPSTDPSWHSTDFNPTFIYPTLGVYQIQLISYRFNTTDTVFDTIAVSHSLDVELGPPDTVLCTDAILTYDLSNNDQYSMSGSCSYHWTAEIGTNVYTYETPTILIDKPGTYSVTVTSDTVCGPKTDQIIVTYNNVEANIGHDVTTGLCEGIDSQPVNATYSDSQFGTTYYYWSTGESSSVIYATQTGTYTVTVELGQCTATDDVYIEFFPVLTPPLNENYYVCQGGVAILNAQNFGASYLWSNGATTQTIAAISAGTYSVSVTNNCMSLVDPAVLNIVTPPIVDLGEPVTICNGTSYIIDATYPYSTYHWSNNQTTAAILVTYGGIYTVTITNQCGSNVASKEIIGLNPGSMELGSDSLVCEGYILDCGVADANFIWSTGETTQSIVITQSDYYSVDVTTNCGNYFDELYLTLLAMNVELGNDITLCPGETVTLDAGNQANLYYWSTGNTTESVTASFAGEYYVVATNACESVSDTIFVSFFDTSLDLGNDTSYCQGESIILDAQHPGSTYLWSTGETTQTITVSQAGAYTVNIFNSCGNLSDSIFVTEYDLPVVGLQDTVYVVDGEVALVDAGSGFTSYLWSNGQTNETIQVGHQAPYYVTVTDINGCTSVDTTFVSIIYNIDTNECAVIQVFPNPAIDFLNIHSSKDIIQVELFNSIGKLLIQQKPVAKELQLNCKITSIGVYFLRLQIENQLITLPVNFIK